MQSRKRLSSGVTKNFLQQNGLEKPFTGELCRSYSTSYFNLGCENLTESSFVTLVRLRILHREIKDARRGTLWAYNSFKIGNLVGRENSWDGEGGGPLAAGLI